MWRALTDWLVTGHAPPRATRLDVTSGAQPDIGRDTDGIARGGIRTPPGEGRPMQ
jgi:hypothetical protein